MIVLLKRADLKVNGLPVDQVRLHHTTLHQSVIDIAELIIFMENGSAFVPFGTKWPANKQMSGAQLLKYIAEHAL